MRWPGLLGRPARRWLAAGAASLFAAYLLLGYFVLPRYIQGAIPEYVAAQLKRKASVGEVRFNPLTFRLELGGVALAEPGGAPILDFRRLVVDFELSSLLRWAWTFSTISLDGLSLHADIAPDGRLNLAALADSFPKGEGAGDAAPPRFVLQHLQLTDGSITFSDRSGSRPRFDTLRPLDIELRDLTTLPDRRGPYSVSAQLAAGGTLAWRGEVSLQPIFSRGEVSLKGAKPAAAWRFLQDRLRLAEPAGELDTGFRYRFAYTDGTLEVALDDIRLGASGLALTQPGAKEPFFALKKLALTGGTFDLAQRELRLPSIELAGGVLRAEADANGELNLLKLVPEAPSQASAAPAPAPGEPWRVKLESVRVGEFAVHYRDFSRAAPLAFAIGALEAGLSAALETGAGDTQANLSDIAVRLSRVTIGEVADKAPLVQLDSVALEGASVELARQSASARRILVKGGAVKVAREQDGRLPLLELAKSKAPAPEPRKPGKPWRLALAAFDIEGLKIALADQGFGQPVAYDIDPLTVSIRNVRTEGRTPIRLEATLRVAQGGMLRVSGEATPAGDRASARASLEGLSLKPLQPVLASRSTLSLDSGEVSATLQAQYRAMKRASELRAGGGVSIDNLLLSEAGGERLLEWKSVAATGIDFSPERLALGEIRVSGLGAKIIVHKDRSLNLAQAFKPPQAVQPAAEPVPQSGQAVLPVSIERVRVDKAAIDFSDLSLVLPFAAKIQDFSGDVLGLSTDRASRAVAKLEGRVDEFGLARVEGSLATYDPKAFMDLRVAFRNIEMSPLSAYSVTFAGRRIASGRLALDLQYKIDAGRLAGANKVQFDKLTLGERVDAPGALSLPLDLAVAILTDAQGRIAMAVPVEGNVDDPQFSYGHLVWQAIASAITNIVSAPFRALFGGGAESLEAIAFDPGRAALLPPEREKLKRVAGALGQRPQLKLVVEGQYSEADRAALRSREVAAAISTLLENEAAAAEPPPVNARDAKTQRAMEALFVKRSSEQALDAFIAETEKSRGKSVERVGALSALVGRASADGAFYDALLARLNESAPLAEDALAKLGAARAAAVTEHLEKTLSVAPERLERKGPAAADGERARLSLDAATQKPL